MFYNNQPATSQQAQEMKSDSQTVRRWFENSFNRRITTSEDATDSNKEPKTEEKIKFKKNFYFIAFDCNKN